MPVIKSFQLFSLRGYVNVSFSVPLLGVLSEEPLLLPLDISAIILATLIVSQIYRNPRESSKTSTAMMSNGCCSKTTFVKLLAISLVGFEYWVLTIINQRIVFFHIFTCSSGRHNHVLTKLNEYLKKTKSADDNILIAPFIVNNSLP